jgi:hypothetical protein
VFGKLHYNISINSRQGTLKIALPYFPTLPSCVLRLRYSEYETYEEYEVV